MATRTENLSQVAGLLFTAISSPRSINLVRFDSGATQYWDFLRVSNRGHDQPVFLGINGATASSSASTTVFLPTPTNKANLYVGKEEVFELCTHLSSLSISTTGTAANVSLTFGRF